MVASRVPVVLVKARVIAAVAMTTAATITARATIAATIIATITAARQLAAIRLARQLCAKRQCASRKFVSNRFARPLAATRRATRRTATQVAIRHAARIRLVDRVATRVTRFMSILCSRCGKKSSCSGCFYWDKNIVNFVTGFLFVDKIGWFVRNPAN